MVDWEWRNEVFYKKRFMIAVRIIRELWKSLSEIVKRKGPCPHYTFILIFEA